MSRQDAVEDGNHNCVANDCPLPASMSTSSNGGAGWKCFCHFGRDKREWADITAELRRLDWLCQAVFLIRGYRGMADYSQKAREAMRLIKLAQRSDLMPAQGESMSAWLNRLQGALHAACAPVAERQGELA